MLPTMPRCASRSMKISETRPSSRRATLVSWGVVLTIRSLVMEGPFHEPPRARRPPGGGGARAGGRGLEVMGGARCAGLEDESGGHGNQFAKRRIRTFRM